MRLYWRLCLRTSIWCVLHLRRISRGSFHYWSIVIVKQMIGNNESIECRQTIWQGNYEGKRFHHISSTDEVYGSLGADCLPRQQLMILILRIQLQKQFRSFCTCLWWNLWFTVCLTNFLIITDLFIFLKIDSVVY
jgi:hypothetical protein